MISSRSVRKQVAEKKMRCRHVINENKNSEVNKLRNRVQCDGLKLNFHIFLLAQQGLK